MKFFLDFFLNSLTLICAKYKNIHETEKRKVRSTLNRKKNGLKINEGN
jgi:hypothetical protein